MVKVDGSVATINKQNFPIGLHVMDLYFPNTPLMKNYDISCTMASFPIFGIGAFKPVIFCAVLKCVNLGPKEHTYTNVWGGNHRELETYPKGIPNLCSKSDLLLSLTYNLQGLLSSDVSKNWIAINNEL